MNFTLNSSVMKSVFFMPSDALRSHLKPATAEQLKVLIHIMNNISTGIDIDATAEFLSIPKENVTDALNYWCDAGIFIREGNEPQTAPQKTRTTAKLDAPLPSREEITMMGAADEKIVFLLRESELKFNRPLRFTEMQSLVSLYADDGMDVSLILMLVEYAISEGKGTVKFINETARLWIAAGVDSVVSAEKQIERRNRQKSAWSIVQKAFGLEERMPSEKELAYSDKWVIEWAFTREMLRAAYEACVDTKAKISLPYIDKILESWHSKGFKTTEQTKIPDKPAKKYQIMETYDKSLVEKMLNNDD